MITNSKTQWTAADLAQWMERMGLDDQRGAATALGCSQALVSLMLSGKSPVNHRTVAIARLYEMEMGGQVAA